MEPTTGLPWAPPGRSERHQLPLLAVRLNQNRPPGPVSRNEYLLALSLRLSDLLQREDDPREASREVARRFLEADLLDDRASPRLNDPWSLSLDLVLDNPLFWESLSLRGLLNPEQWSPPRQDRPNARAARALQEVSLEEWLDRALPKQRLD